MSDFSHSNIFLRTPNSREANENLEEIEGACQSNCIKEGSVIDDFLLEKEISHGGQGVVFRALQRGFNRKVALKLLLSHRRASETSRRRFYREIETLGRLQHNNIIKVHTIGETDSIPYFAMEFVEGQDLKSILNARACSGSNKKLDCGLGVLPTKNHAEEVATLVSQLASALHLAHTVQILHRDIKPANILVRDSGIPVLIDFGLAKLLDKEDITCSDSALGTPAYISPEQIQNNSDSIDCRADIYSLGVLLYELLTLEKPFQGNEQALRHAIVHDDPAPIRKLNPRVPKDLQTICDKAMEKCPDDRYKSAAELEKDLNRFLVHKPIRATRPSAGKRIIKFIRREPAKALSAFLTMSLLVVVPLFLLIAQEVRSDAYRRGSHLGQLRQLIVVAEKDLLIAHPSKVDDLRNWLEKATALMDSLKIHKANLAELREIGVASEGLSNYLQHKHANTIQKIEDNKKALRRACQQESASQRDIDTRTVSNEEEVGRSIDSINRSIASLEKSLPPKEEQFIYSFADEANQESHRILEELVHELEHWASLDSQKSLYARVRQVLANSLSMQEEMGHYDPVWKATIASIRNHPAYGGMIMEKQSDLVPIGQDPKSKLWEFAHVPSGEIPKRNSTGELILQPAMGLVFVLIPGGFVRDPQFQKDVIRIAPYFLSKYEMTQGQWEYVTEENPSLHGEGSSWPKGEILLHPVDHVSWLHCRSVLDNLNLTFPTCAQWKYALLKGKFFEVVDFQVQVYAYGNYWHEVVHVRDNPIDGHAVHAPVGTFNGNALGLYDMFGNVAELCLDWWPGASTPIVPETGQYVVHAGTSRTSMGAGFKSTLFQVPLWSKGSYVRPNYLSNDLGVRPARLLETESVMQ